MPKPTCLGIIEQPWRVQFAAGKMLDNEVSGRFAGCWHGISATDRRPQVALGLSSPRIQGARLVRAASELTFFPPGNCRLGSHSSDAVNNRAVQIRIASKLEFVRAIALLALAGPSPHRHRWGRRRIAAALRLAQRCLAYKDVRRAVVLLEFVAKASPTLAIAHICLAKALVASNDLYAARQAVSAAIRATPHSPASLSRITALQLQLGGIDSVQHLLDTALHQFPESCALLNALGSIYSEYHELDKALECFRQVERIAPTMHVRLNVMLNIGECFDLAGHKDAAIAQYRDIIATAPHDVRPYSRLAFCQPGPDLDRDLTAAIVSLLPLSKDNDGAEPHYALGQLYERSGRTGDAFAHFHLANEKRAAAIGLFSVEALRAGVEARETTFSSDRIADLRRYGWQHEGPIFVVGMPRSGTTLVEQILSSHSAACGLGEREDVARLIRALRGELRSRKEYPWCAAELSQTTVHRLSDSLAEGLSSGLPPGSRFVTKTPEDFWELGLISIFLPKARIIHCKRHPVDTCLSCYMQNFIWVPYATSLDRLAAVYRLYQRIMQHWGSVLPSPILEVEYEDLVGRPWEVVSQLCTFCGLQFEESCMRFHKNLRPVNCASRWQVRRPLYDTSIGRWERYREFLGPLLALAEESTTVADIGSGLRSNPGGTPH